MLQEESSGTVPTSQSVGEEVCRAAEIILCLCSLLEALGGGGGEGREVAAEALLLQVSPAVLKLC